MLFQYFLCSTEVLQRKYCGTVEEVLYYFFDSTYQGMKFCIDVWEDSAVFCRIFL